jgi:protein O-mannosyl-transferase
MHKHQRYLLLAALPLFVLGALSLHYYSFAGPMYYDSVIQLESKEHIYASGDLLKVIQLFPQRPVAMASFYLNYLIWGMNPFYFRFINAIILGLTAFMATVAFVLILSIAEPARPENKGQKQAVGIFLGLVFLTHPVQTYFVAYIWQRVGLLCCFFYISALAAYLAVRSGRIPYTVAGYAICLVLFLLALASKEKAVTLPVVLVLAEIAFFRAGWKSVLKRTGVFAAILIPLLVVLSHIVRPYGLEAETPGILTTIAKYYDQSNLTLSQVSISQCRVLFSYLALIVAPVPSNVRITTAHVIFSSPLESPVIAASVLGAIAVLAAGVFLIRKRPLTGFGLLFFLVNLAPESILVPRYLFFAYRVNLPMFGLLLVLGDLVLEVWARTGSPARRKWYCGASAAALLAVMVIALISVVTISKAKLWQDPVAFWRDIVDGLPAYNENVEKRVTADALNGLGSTLLKEARASEAVTILRRAAEIDPQYKGMYVNLGVAYAQLGDMSEAESTLKRAVEIDPAPENAEFALAKFYMTQDRLSEAWLHMKNIVDLVPSDPRGFNGMGTISIRQGNFSEAVSSLRKAIEIAPGFDEAHYNLGEAFVGLRQDEKAARHFRKALELKRENWQAHNSLGMLLAKSGNVREATMHFGEALALNPGNWRVHNNLGAMNAKSGNFKQAAEHFQEALRINPEDISAKKNLERIRTLTGGPPAK